MNLLARDVKAYADVMKIGTPDFYKWCDVVLCVPFTSITAAVRAFRNSRINVGAQNISQYESGAYTGEISALQVKDIGAKYVIIGHSERREHFAETDEMINTKIVRALENSLRPIVCVGESIAQRERGVTDDILAAQVKLALSGIERSDG